MKLSLMVLNSGKASGQTIPIPTAQFVIGRDPKCHLRPASAMISKQHCAIIVKDGRVYLKDFNSTNGTFLNEQPVKGAVPLKNGDALKVGPLTFKVVIEGEVTVNKPTPTPKPKAATPPPPAPEDDSAAALLLSLEDDQAGGEPEVSTTEDAESIPGGSTIMELPAILRQGDTAEGKIAPTTTDQPAAPEKPPEKKPEPKKSGDSAQTAAQAILDRYKKGRRAPS